MMKTSSKSLHDFEASLAVIASNVQAYRSGNVHAYRPLAVELRKLLCDTQAGTDNSLAPRIMPEFRLRPLLRTRTSIDSETTLQIPGIIHFDGKGGSKFEALFNENGPSLPLQEWQDQQLFDASTTMRSFIRSVADKEAAHSDKTYNKILGKTKSVSLAQESLVGTVILTIACYVVRAIAIRLVNENLAQIGAQVLADYNRDGRGVVVLDSSDFAVQSSKGLPLIWKSTSMAETFFKADSDKKSEALKILETYDPSKDFILLVVDLTGEIWLYQQTLAKNP